jgi:hypothetical protein
MIFQGCSINLFQASPGYRSAAAPGRRSPHRTDGAEDIGRLGVLVMRDAWPGAAFGPSSRHLVLLADPGFVLKPHFYTGVRRERGTDRQLFLRLVTRPHRDPPVPSTHGLPSSRRTTGQILHTASGPPHGSPGAARFQPTPQRLPLSIIEPAWLTRRLTIDQTVRPDSASNPRVWFASTEAFARARSVKAPKSLRTAKYQNPLQGPLNPGWH